MFCDLSALDKVFPVSGMFCCNVGGISDLGSLLEKTLSKDRIQFIRTASVPFLWFSLYLYNNWGFTNKNFV